MVCSLLRIGVWLLELLFLRFQSFLLKLFRPHGSSLASSIGFGLVLIVFCIILVVSCFIVVSFSAVVVKGPVHVVRPLF